MGTDLVREAVDARRADGVRVRPSADAPDRRRISGRASLPGDGLPYDLSVMPEVATATLVGRERELDAIGRFLERVPEGPSALLIEGEAGIGKTTVWLEALRLADETGLRVLRARPAEAEARLSYVALADLVGTAFDETQALLPAVQERALGSALLRGEPGADAASRTTATSLVSVLTSLAEREPVLVAVDDLQWLDPATEQALAFAFRRLPRRLGLLLARRV